MGWYIEGDDEDLELAYSHEGYVVAVVSHYGDWRELGIDDEGTHRLEYVQVGCSCGWRSERYIAPFGSEWSPCSTFLPSDRDEQDAVEVWKFQHRGHITPRSVLASAARRAREQAVR